MSHLSTLGTFKKTLEEFLDHFSTLTYMEFQRTFSLILSASDYNSHKSVFTTKGIASDGENFALQIGFETSDLYLVFPKISKEKGFHNLRPLNNLTFSLSSASRSSFGQISFYARKNSRWTKKIEQPIPSPYKLRLILMDIWLGANPRKIVYPIVLQKIHAATELYEKLKKICQEDLLKDHNHIKNDPPITNYSPLTDAKELKKLSLEKVLICVKKQDEGSEDSSSKRASAAVLESSLFDVTISKAEKRLIGGASQSNSHSRTPAHHALPLPQGDEWEFNRMLDVQFLFSDNVIFSRDETMPDEYRKVVLSKLPNIWNNNKKTFVHNFLGISEDQICTDPLMVAKWKEHCGINSNEYNFWNNDDWYDDEHNDDEYDDEYSDDSYWNTPELGFVGSLKAVFQRRFGLAMDALIKSSKNLDSCALYLVEGFDKNNDRRSVKIESLGWKHYCLDPKSQRRSLNFHGCHMAELNIISEHLDFDNILNRISKSIDDCVDQLLLHENTGHMNRLMLPTKNQRNSQNKREELKDEIAQFLKYYPSMEICVRPQEFKNNDCKFFELMSFDMGTKRLEFHNFGIMSRELLSGNASLFYLLEQPWRPALHSTYVFNHQDIHALCQVFRHMGQEHQSLHISHRFQPHVINVSEASPTLVIDVNEHDFSVITEFAWNGRKLRASNMGSELMGWLRTLKNRGLYQLLPDLNSDDEGDHVFFHSMSVAFIVILESLSYLLDSTDSEGRSLQNESQFFENLFSKLHLLLENRSRSSKSDRSEKPLNLRKWIGQSTLNYFQKFIQNSFLNPEKQCGRFVIDQQLILVEGFYRPQMRLILSYLKALFLKSEGRLLNRKRDTSLFDEIETIYQMTSTECLIAKQFHLDLDHDVRFKDEMGELDRQLIHLYKWTPHPWKRQMNPSLFPTDPDWIEMTSNLSEVSLRIRGKSLEKIDASRLKVQFNLVENHGKGCGTEQSEGLIVNNTALDWFELHPQYHLDGKPILESDAQNLIKGQLLIHQGNYYLLNEKKFPMAKTLTLFWENLRGHSNNDHLGLSKDKKEGSEEPKSRHTTLELLALRAMGIPVVGHQKWSEICNYFDRMNMGRDLLKTPPHLEGILKPYQRIGVQWLYDLCRTDLGGILADDMGLGKTLQILTFLSLLKEEKRLGPTLIVVPTSLVFNWIYEAQKFTPDLEFLVFDSKQKNIPLVSEKIILITYGLLYNNAESLKQVPWELMILDEAQSVKTASTQRYRTVAEIPARMKLALTGTPFENHLGELYNIMNLVVPGALGRRDVYNATYVNPSHIRKEDIDFLKMKMRPLILRRRKSEILKDLPDKREIKLVLPFEKLQKKIYRNVALSWNDRVKDSVTKLGEAKSQIMMLTALLRLRQVCSDPASIPNQKYSDLPPKVEDLIEKLCEIVAEGQSALVFTQFLSTYKRIEKELLKKSISCFAIHGATSRKDRERNLRDFNQDSTPSVMLMTLKTGGVGLNLTKASFVFHIEPWWNPAVENQATDRAYRMGQTQDVQVFRYIMQESVEEKIQTLKMQKSTLFDKMLGDEMINEESEKESKYFKPEGALLSEKDFQYLISH